MKKMTLIILFIATIIDCKFAVSCYASEESVYVNDAGVLMLRSTTTNHSIARKILYVPDIPGLPSGTVGLWLDEDADMATYALLLAAKTKNRPVTIRYEPTITSPWGDSTAKAITAVDIY